MTDFHKENIENPLQFRPSLIVYDFDGVMTDNHVYIDENGRESVMVHRGDGAGVELIREKLKIPQIILSTEANPVVLRRAEKLKIPTINNTGQKKAEILIEYCLKQSLDIKKAIYVGNDLNDYEAMMNCGYRVCPNDAECEIVAIADFVTNAKGGFGVVRELYRFLSEVRYGQEDH